MKKTEINGLFQQCLVTACFGAEYRVLVEGEEQKAFLGGRFRINTGDYNPLTIGDRVTLRKEKSSWLITEIEERKNCFCRKAPGRLLVRQALGANIDQVMAVFSVAQPRFVQLKLDTILAAAVHTGIPAIILLNKIDLLTEDKTEKWNRIINVYADAGFPVLLTSAKDGRGLDQVSNLLRDKMSILSGPSGMGKSTILNALFPGLGLKVKKLARKSGLGTHTTGFSRLFPLPTGGYVGDTPGSRYFILWDVPSRQLASCFPEIEQLSELCRFDDCSHGTEPECGVLNALRKGELSKERFKSYRVLYEKILKKEKERGFTPPQIR